MLGLAARRCQGFHNVVLSQGEATSLPVEDSSFDAALCVQVLEYVPGVRVALGELYRALRPGGRAVVWDVDWASVSWHSLDRGRMDEVLRAWDEHLAHPSLPRVLAPALREAGFEQVEMHPYSFASAEFDPDTYGAALVPLISRFVAGRRTITESQATAWAAEQQQLGERREYYFACTQCCFTATRPS
jgi:ubiquinone/menaquinone biosynthesis C-methylase UbiE